MNIDINKQYLLVFLLIGLLTINATTPNATIPNEAEGSISQEDNAKSAIKHAQEHSDKIEYEEKKSCEANDGKYKDGKCKFKDGDDSDARGSFDHDLEDKGLYDNYAQRNADDDDDLEESYPEYKEKEYGSGKDEDEDGREDSNDLEWENNDYKDEEGADD